MSHTNKERILWKLTKEYFDYMNETSSVVDIFIRKIIEESKSRIINTPEENKLYQKLYDAFRSKIGKPKLRSNAFRLGYEICGGMDWEKIAQVAAAMDTIDASFYSADDIFDQDVTEKEIIQSKYIVSHILETISFKLILDGAKKLQLPSEIIISICEIWYTFVRDIYEGFYIDVFKTKNDLNFYLRRTYAYNYWEHHMKIAALFANAPKGSIQHLSEFGRNIGMSYMMANDVMDLGKDYEDIKNGRYTLPIIYSLRHMDKKQQKNFFDVFGNQKASGDDLITVAQTIVDTKSIDFCLRYIYKYCFKALKNLEIFRDCKQKRLLQYTTAAAFKNKSFREISTRFGYKRKVESPLWNFIKNNHHLGSQD